MRICIRIKGRWLKSEHFLGGEKFDQIMLIILNSNSFSVYEDGKLKNTYNIEDIADKIRWDDDIEYSWMEKRGKPVPVSTFKVDYQSGTHGVMDYEFDSQSEFDITKLKFSRILTNCKIPEIYGDSPVYLMEPVVGYSNKTIFTWTFLEQQEDIGPVDFSMSTEVNYSPKLRGKYSTPINTASGLIFADPGKTILAGHTKKVPENLVIPKGVKVILEDSFENCTGIKTVTFPETLEKIQKDAFAGCDEIAELNFNSNMEIDFDNDFIDWSTVSKVSFENSTRYKFTDGIISSADGSIVYRACAKDD